MLHITATVTAHDAESTERTFQFDLVELLRTKTIETNGVRVQLLGGLVCLDWAASLGLHPVFFAKHCRIPLKRLKTGKPFTQTLAWEEPTDGGVRNVEVRLDVHHG